MARLPYLAASVLIVYALGFAIGGGAHLLFNLMGVK